MSDPLVSLGPVARVRGSFSHVRAALARGRITVGFLGGSITAARTGTRWPEPFLAGLLATYPGLRVVVENAAIGATGSDLAVFRAQRDIIARGCDLVFVEYSVNDFDQPTGQRRRTREGLVRQLLAAPCDVVIVHAFRQEMLPDLLAGRLAASVAEFEELAAHYDMSSVDMGLHALREVRGGLLKWEEWLPDGLHPEQRGSLSYAQSVNAFFADALARPAGSAEGRERLSVPLSAGAWERVSFVPFSEVELDGPWTVRRWVSDAWIDQVLHCTAQDATLRFKFTGRGLVLGFDFGHASGEIRYRIDGGAWEQTHRERFAWHGDSGWFRPTLIADDLTTGNHTFELKAIPALHAGRVAAGTTVAFFGVMH